MKYIKRTSDLVNHKMHNSYLASLLYDRQIISQDRQDLLDFLNPKKDMLISPYLLDNIEDGAKLLIDFLQQNKKILFVVDSDLDGFTSSAELWNYIIWHFPDAQLQYYLHDGKQHGLEDCYEYILTQNVDLVICPDSSSNDYEYHKILSEHNISI